MQSSRRTRRDSSVRGKAIARSIAAAGVKAIADGVGGHDDSERIVA
jgi:serine/threonine protein phosphatase PrpC